MILLVAIALACGPAVGGSLPGPGPGPAAGGEPFEAAGGSGGTGGGAVAPSPELACENGADDDGDGAVDCDDPDCVPDTLLAGDLDDPSAWYVPGASGHDLVLYAATGLTGARRRIRALPLEDARPAGTAQVVYEGRSVNVEGQARPGGGFVVALADKESSHIELAMLDADGALEDTVPVADGDEARPLISAAVDPSGDAIALLRTRDQLRMELGWFALDGTPLAPWRDVNVLEFRSARLVVSGGKVWLLYLPNFPDDAIRGRRVAVRPDGYLAGELPPLRAHSHPLVPLDGEILFHSQGADTLPGSSPYGPEWVRVDLAGNVLARFEVAQPLGPLRLATFVGAWDGGAAAVYPGLVDGNEGLVVVRASADLSRVDPAAPLLPGLPTVVHLASTPQEDRTFYVNEAGTQLRVHVVPAHCRPQNT